MKKVTAKKRSFAKTRRKGMPRDKPVSLAPLDFGQALAGLLAVKPAPKPKRKRKVSRKKKTG